MTISGRGDALEPAALTEGVVLSGHSAGLKRTDLPERRRGWQGVFLSMSAILLLADVAAWAVSWLISYHGDTLEIAMTAMVALSLAAQRLYQSHLTASVLDMLPGILVACCSAFVLTLVVVKLRWPDVFALDVFRRAVVFAVCIIVFRAIAVAVVRYARRKRIIAHRTLVLGAGTVGAALLDRLHNHPEAGLLPVAVLDPFPIHTDKTMGVTWLGSVDDLAAVIEEQRINVVVVAFSSVREADLVDVLRTCDRLECEFFFVPRLFELQHVHGDMEQVHGMPLVRVRRAAFRTPAWKVKRLFDIAFSGALLVLAAPVMAAIALAVRLEGGPGVLFKQVRVGIDGRPFTMLKFRSMKPVNDAEQQTQWNISNDKRVGPVGKVLRVTSLDELPQLWNVLRGDMSIVGPRPERPHFVDEFSSHIPRYTGRHRVPAGLTGLAAVHGLRGDTSIAERIMLDNHYIENWSLWLDVKILLRTVGALFRHPGS
ncbi:Undecaprenyl-phosphate glucose phosphotransferase [Quadrisphaera granulorum]|uniref:Undecaprenyl-phosphate glucose phosphotransferase n=1 Tax=Quadrisphaera granulorum TaxID=317664 RepID=A0A316AER7_9ACTN|nr:sugar transferase [Quadrisphaera granulorum]PWJ56082.1 Undecaprenyl-phosphate glucose phosphotransferase [Quadrisphaera granulorum]SZE94716.1 Undecaprenyl-phosphate glucose phosphotransferase [Quadrisphaera granulorum]